MSRTKKGTKEDTLKEDTKREVNNSLERFYIIKGDGIIDAKNMIENAEEILLESWLWVYEFATFQHIHNFRWPNNFWY